MKATDFLKTARDLIADPERWTKGAYARHRDGELCAIEDKGACQWCAIGALFWATDVADTDEADEEIEDISTERFAMGMLYDATCALGARGGVAEFNDAPERTHEEVMALYDKAIALAAEREAAWEGRAS